MAINSYLAPTDRKQTPQRKPIPGRTDQTRNSAGGYVFQLDDWTRLDRFLVLGTEGGTYYVNSSTLTRDNAAVVDRLIAEGHDSCTRLVDRIVEVSEAGRAASNTPAIFALALVAKTATAPDSRRYALDHLQQVCRTGTHLFEFAAAVDALGGWGRATCRAFAKWYTDKLPHKLAYQLVKYQQRGGWSHRDILRLCKPRPERGSVTDRLLAWAVGKHAAGTPFPTDTVRAFEAAKVSDSPRTTITLINDNHLTHEMVKSEHLNEPEVWEALLERIPMTALVRNLGKMTSVGTLLGLGKGNQQAAIRTVVDKLTNADYVRKSRLHPVTVLSALRTYAQGRGVKGSLTWSPQPMVLDVLDGAFYLAFDNVEPSGKRIYIGLDVSGSMCAPFSDRSYLSCREAAAAMAMVWARREPWVVVKGFTSGVGGSYYSAALSDLPITKRTTLNSAITTTGSLPFGATDCALPMLDAINSNLDVDAFIIITDSETWAGKTHPCQALQQYRRKSGIAAKLIVIGMTSTGFTIADPNDAGTLDVVGFDTSTPTMVQDFLAREAGSSYRLS